MLGRGSVDATLSRAPSSPESLPHFCACWFFFIRSRRLYLATLLRYLQLPDFADLVVTDMAIARNGRFIDS